MKRELKFRAWWKGINQMKYFIQGHFEDTPSGWAMTFIQPDGGQTIFIGPAEIMQFTGLTDKNGVEIYEGDIVNANGSESVLDHDFSEARKFVSPIIQDSRHFEQRRSAYKVYWQWNFCQFSFFSLSNPQHSIESNIDKRELEVIGNIYEHPHLINKTETA